LTRPELVFVGQIAPAAAVLGEPVARQAASVISRLERALAERKLSSEDLLRLRLFAGDLDDLPAIERAIDSAFGPAQRPAMSVVELPAGSAAGVAVTLDAVAAPGAREHRRLGPHSARLGPWVFLGAVPGIAARRGVPGQRRIHEESRALFARMEELLRAQDAELRDVVKVGGWLTFPIRRSDYQPLGEVREALLSDAGLFPASAAVQVGRALTDGALLAFEAIAFAPEDPGERERWRATPLPPPSPLAPYYASARGAGGYVFTCGEVPTGTAGADRPAPVDVQAGEVYERLGADLAAHGASPANVLHQTVFVRRLRDRDAAVDAARAFFGHGTQPPTTMLGVADIGFHPGCDVEIELVAATDGRCADAR
jgi:enamine deaminase RidA (YjgF/YER057c/UK114 family)